MSEVDDAIARAEDIERLGLNGDPAQARADRILLAKELKNLRRGVTLLVQDQHLDVQTLRDEIELLRNYGKTSEELADEAERGYAVAGMGLALRILDDREEDDEREHRG